MSGSQATQDWARGRKWVKVAEAVSNVDGEALAHCKQLIEAGRKEVSVAELMAMSSPQPAGDLPVPNVAHIVQTGAGEGPPAVEGGDGVAAVEEAPTAGPREDSGLITLSRKALTAAVSQVMPMVTAARYGVSALGGILLRTGPDGLTLTATDLEGSVQVTVPGDGGALNAVVPGRVLKEAIAAARSDEVTLEEDGVLAVTVKAGGSSSRILTMPLKDFPKLPSSDEHVVLLATQPLVGSLKRVLTAASKDMARPMLCSVLFDVEPAKHTVTLVATDSWRLVTAEVHAVTGELDHGTDRKLAVPRKVAEQLVKVAGKSDGHTAVRVGSNSIEFEVDGTKVSGRLADGDYPNWRQLVPKAGDQPTVFLYDKADLLAALKVLGPVTKNGNPVRLDLAAGTLSAGTQDVGEGTFTLTGSEHSGDALVVAFNPAYLRACIEATDGAPMQLKDGLKPAVFEHPSRPGTVRALLMPVRVS